ncbi:hypothetical protein [Paenarthrobacter histidinolovorans]|uniref:hypothetical protein n=1 Tax=Paenarthrobacter histidinolovorans TaxID=43664 RepID=UPI001662AF5C|nr:hypothetical protein [Paenarthrobacter histidinolovorans]GGJ20365.1 hypothetical protein GCM10010052_17110 [Paenarthrobacter histidinolovorans]
MDSSPSTPDDFRRLFAEEIAAQPVLSAEDLSRVSMERHQGKSVLARDAPSVGALRLSGQGVTGHEAALDDVTSLGLAFQRLVTAIGASLGGFTNIRGPIPKEFSAKTILGLRAAPRPGSIILDLMPRLDPIRELRHKGELFNDSDTQLVDAVMSELEVLVNAAADHQPGRNDSPFSAEVRSLGPRAASALKGFALAASTSHFDLDMTWSQPLHATTRFHLSARDAVFIAQVISGQKLDAENVTVHGTLRTVSHGKKWELLASEFGNISIDVSELEGRPWAEWNPDDLVEVDAAMTITQAPGRPSTRSLVAQRISRWAGSLDDIARTFDEDENS